jgi:hypothetical protein
MEIELSGPHGNAFYLMAFVEKIGSQLRLSVEKKNKILMDMKSGDYKNLLKVFIENFGEVVTLKENGEPYCIEE